MLNTKQQQVIDLLISGHDTIMSGSAGSGKTYVINELTKVADDKGIALIKLAPTGIAASHIDGATIHSTLAIDIAPLVQYSMSWPGRVRQVSNGMEAILEHFTEAIVVIDEISMVRADLMDAVLDKLSQIDYCDITILLSGDTAQLPPVQLNAGTEVDEVALYNKMVTIYGSNRPYFFKALRLKTMKFTRVTLDEIFRQKDSLSVRAMNSIRKPKDLAQMKGIIKWLSDYKRKIPLDLIPEDALIVTPTNDSADQYNNMMLAKLSTKSGRSIVDSRIKMGSTLFPRVFEYKIGAKIQVIRNMPDSELKNGQRGTIIDFDRDSITINVNGQEHVVTKINEGNATYGLSQSGHVVVSKNLKFTQFPIKLGWATTVHKAQGMNAKRVHLLNRTVQGKKLNFWDAGMLYVACSRCENINNITVSADLSRKDFVVGKIDFDI